MSDSGNSGFGYRPAPVAAVKTKAQPAAGEPGAVVCERCSHEGTCTCPTILADAIERWTGADYETAARLASDVWGNTRDFRVGEQNISYTPLTRDCTFCGAAVRKLDGGILVTTAVSSGAEPVDDPICPDSPTHTHALP